MKRAGTEVKAKYIDQVGFDETEGLPSCMRFTPCTQAGDLGIPHADGLLTNLGEQIKERQPHKPSKLPNLGLADVVGKL